MGATLGLTPFVRTQAGLSSSEIVGLLVHYFGPALLQGVVVLACLRRV